MRASAGSSPSRLTDWLNAPDASGRPRRKSIQSVGALGTLSVAETDLPASPRLPSFVDRFAERRDQLASNPEALEVRIPVLTPSQLSQLRAGVVARTPDDYRRTLLRWSGVFLLAFYFAHAWLSVRKVGGDRMLLPIIHALCGVGLVMMAGLRDPLRDALLFVRFAQGVGDRLRRAGGCVDDRLPAIDRPAPQLRAAARRRPAVAAPDRASAAVQGPATPRST